MNWKAALLAMAVLFASMAFDYGMTYRGVTERGVDAEANPYIRGLMREVGPLKGLLFMSHYAVYMVMLVAGWRWAGVALALVMAFGHLKAGLSWLD